jgi:putative DNA primase/helicase
VSTPTNIMLMVTANNLDVRGDLRRRVMLLRLDARVERPELRRFTTDFLHEITRQRGELVEAALTIVRAYLTCGEVQADLPTFGGFEHWSSWCREPLTWLGMPDPLLASEVLRAQDPDLAIQQQFFNAWARIFQDQQVTAAQVIKVSEEKEGLMKDAALVNPDLRSALDVVCQERLAPRRLTYWLQRHEGRMADGFRLERMGFDQFKTMLWKLGKY